jgi:hypothetical protein
MAGRSACDRRSHAPLMFEVQAAPDPAIAVAALIHALGLKTSARASKWTRALKTLARKSRWTRSAVNLPPRLYFACRPPARCLLPAACFRAPRLLAVLAPVLTSDSRFPALADRVCARAHSET